VSLLLKELEKTLDVMAERIALLENAIAQHKLKQWGGEDVEVSSDVDAALYAHLQN